MSTRSFDTMINPQIEELLDRVDSKFSLVTLAARRARQINSYFNQLVPQQRETEMYEALRTGALDAAFGDSLRMSFWMNSDGARKCCTGLGGGVMDPETFSRPLVYIVRKDKGAVRDRFDEALDQLEEKGATAEIFGRYLPAPIW